MRNIWGVCASHLSARPMVAATRPSRALLSVSASLSANRPPTSSQRQASISALICTGVMRQRAASCTSTQSCGAPPRASRAFKPFSTLRARVAPPHWAIDMGTDEPMALNLAESRKSSPSATTTRIPSSDSTSPNAASVCTTNGLPATGWYCFGEADSARLPAPAQGTSAQRRGAVNGEAGRFGGDWVMNAKRCRPLF